jgi:predicted anti-sigma-YlaC factor YlaD
MYESVFAEHAGGVSKNTGGGRKTVFRLLGCRSRGMRNHHLSKIAPFLISLFVLLSSGCSIRRMAIKQVSNTVASGGATFSRDNDPELIRQAGPFSLKLMESLLEEVPRNRALLLATSKRFTQYTYGFIQEDADEIESQDLEAAGRLRDRARLLYLRARDYGLRGLELSHPGFDTALRRDPSSAVSVVQSISDVPFLYWTAAAWGAAISISKDRPDLIADRPAVEALIDRALALDEQFDFGSIHSFLIAYEPSRPGGTGDPAVRGRKHFERAVELTKGQLASPYVSFAENISVRKQNRAEFQSLLQRALEIDPNTRPEWRLENLLMQRRARWLLSRQDALFVE